MLTTNQIDLLRDRIAESLKPEKIYLFGSYALGTATEESDVDLVVVMDSNCAPHQRNVALKRLFPRRNFSLDAFVFTPQEFSRFKDVPGTILYNAVRYGKLLYG